MNLHRNVQSSFELRDETWSKQVETDKVCNWALAKTREMSNTNAAMDLLQHTFQLESLHSYEWETRRMSQEVLKKNNINDRRVIKNAICQLEIFMFHVAGCPQGTEMIACHSGLILAQDIWNQRFHLTRLMMRHLVYWVGARWHQCSQYYHPPPHRQEVHDWLSTSILSGPFCQLAFILSRQERNRTVSSQWTQPPVRVQVNLTTTATLNTEGSDHCRQVAVMGR